MANLPNVEVDHIKRNERHERGIIHKAVAHRRGFKEHFKGDTFSLTKKLDSIQPKSVKGIVGVSAAKGTYNFVKVSGRLAENAAMGAENVALLAKDSAVQHLDRKLRFETEISSDTGKAVVKTTGMVIKGVNGIRRYSASKKNYKHEKGLLKQYKGEYQKTFDSLHNAVFKSKIIPWIEVYDRKDKVHLKQSKQKLKGYKQSVKQSGNTPVQKQRLKLRKKRVKAESKEVHRNNLMLKMQKDRVKLQKRIARKDKPVPLALQPGVHAVKSAASSGWNKAVSADSSNDVMKAIDKSASLFKKGANAAAAAQHASNQLQLKLYNKSIASEQKSMFKKKNPAFKQKKRNPSFARSLQKKWKKWKNPTAKNHYASFGDFVKDIGKTLIKSLRNSIKGSLAHLLVAALPVCFSVVCMLLIFSMIMSIFQKTEFLYAAYPAKDKALTDASEYYTLLAYKLNESVLNCGNKSTWRKGLNEQGISAYNFITYPDDPDQMLYGKNNNHLNYDEAPYDYDPYILWSFLCAYHYDFEASEKAKNENKQYDPKYWTCDIKTKDEIKKLFNREYEFKFSYNNTSHWEDLDNYVYYGGGNSINGSYYFCEPTMYKNSGQWTYKFKPTSWGNSEFHNYFDNEGFCYINSNYRVLDAKKNFKETGYYILDNRYYADGNHSVEPFYWADEHNNFFFRNKSGNNQYRLFCGWDSDDAWFVISPGDTKARWGNENCATYGYVKKKYWQTDCILYYVVTQKNTFEESAKSLLKEMSHGDERVDYFNGLMGSANDKYYGNHQLFDNPVYSNKSIHQLVNEGKIYNYHGRNLKGWNIEHALTVSNHNGIDIICNTNTAVRSVIEGTITDIDTSEQSIEITSENNFDFWYDDKKNTVQVTYTNIKVKDGLQIGDKVQANQIVGTVTDYKRCYGNKYYNATQSYLHIVIRTGKNKTAFSTIDPMLSFY